jgi:TRAP-type C4-dicarboxylate transport system permease small subunit
VKRQFERLSALLLAVMFLVTLFQVAARILFRVPSVWTEELARFVYVCIVFVGTIPLIRDDENIRVGVLTDRVRGRGAALLRLGTTIVTIPFIGIMTWGAWTNTVANWRTYAPTLDWLSIGYIYLVIFLAGVFMLWYLAVNLVRSMRASLAPAPAAPGGAP